MSEHTKIRRHLTIVALHMIEASKQAEEMGRLGLDLHTEVQFSGAAVIMKIADRIEQLAEAHPG